MFSKFLASVLAAVTRVKEPRLLRFYCFAGTGAIVLLSWLVAVPLWFNPYVRVPGSELVISLDCLPTNLSLESPTRHARLLAAQLIVSDADGIRSPSAFTLEAQNDSDSSVSGVQLVVPVASRTAAAKAVADIGLKRRVKASLQFARSPYIDFKSLLVAYDKSNDPECKPRKLVGEQLADRLQSTPSPKLMHYFLLHDELSDLVHLVNDAVSNFLLAVLVLSALWQIGGALQGLKLLYFKSDDAILDEFRQQFDAASDEAKALGKEEFVTEQFLWRRRRFVFARVLGPAVGFMITVSSLISGLHPEVQMNQDTYGFIASLQIALVATLMGLVVRILAELALRFHRDSTERLLALIFSKQSEVVSS